MTSAIIASLVATLALGYVEGMGRFYPARQTWLRLRSRHGRRAVKAMRERMAKTAEARAPRVVATVLFGLCLGWIASASLLDKRWYEVVFDVIPYVIVGAAVLRIPPNLRKIAARMKRLEEELGRDDFKDEGDGGAAVVAL